MRLGAPAAIVAFVVALAACGGGGPAIDAKGAELLQAEGAAARNAAARGDGAGATEMLSTVDRTVEALRKQDKITATKAGDVQAAVEVVRAALSRSLPTTTVTSPPPTVVPVPDTAAPDVRPADNGDGDRGNNGKGKGRHKREQRDDD